MPWLVVAIVIVIAVYVIARQSRLRRDRRHWIDHDGGTSFGSHHHHHHHRDDAGSAAATATAAVLIAGTAHANPTSDGPGNEDQSNTGWFGGGDSGDSGGDSGGGSDSGGGGGDSGGGSSD